MKSGEVIAGKYRLDKRLGVGGMGEVWRAAHTGTERAYAIKFLHAHAAESASARHRFTREAKASAKINHANIIDIFDVGELPEGTLYLAMELLEGVSLADAFHASPPLSVQDLLVAMRDTAEGLAAAHAVGIVHRDVKPANIFLHKDRATGFVAVKLLDFGISKFGDETGSTKAGSVLGSPRYMSPEQTRHASKVDARTDLWAAGVILFEGLTGTFPHEGDSFSSLVVAIITQEPISIDQLAPGLPEPVRAIVRDLIKPIDERIQTATELVARINQALTDPAIARIPLPRPLHPPAGESVRTATGLRMRPLGDPGSTGAIRVSQPLVDPGSTGAIRAAQPGLPAPSATQNSAPQPASRMSSPGFNAASADQPRAPTFGAPPAAPTFGAPPAAPSFGAPPQPGAPINPYGATHKVQNPVELLREAQAIASKSSQAAPSPPPPAQASQTERPAAPAIESPPAPPPPPPRPPSSSLPDEATAIVADPRMQGDSRASIPTDMRASSVGFGAPSATGSFRATNKTLPISATAHLQAELAKAREEFERQQFTSAPTTPAFDPRISQSAARVSMPDPLVGTASAMSLPSPTDPRAQAPNAVAPMGAPAAIPPHDAAPPGTGSALKIAALVLSVVLIGIVIAIIATLRSSSGDERAPAASASATPVSSAPAPAPSPTESAPPAPTAKAEEPSPAASANAPAPSGTSTSAPTKTKAEKGKAGSPSSKVKKLGSGL